MPTSSSKAPKRKSRGRQKMEMVKMENKNNLQVTFSKRRAGLFKKASELCTLCGAEAIIVVFSPTEKPYSFAHPNMETMVNRYLDGNSPAPHSTISQVIIDAHRESTIRNLNLELTQVESMLALEKRRGEEIDLMRKICEIEKWFPTDENEGDHGLDFEQVCVLKNTVLNFKKILEDGAQKSMDGLSNLAEPPMGNNNENVLGDFSFDVGGPSTNNIPTYGTTPLSVGGFVNGFYPIDNAAGATGFTNNSTDFYTPAMVEYNPLN